MSKIRFQKSPLNPVIPRTPGSFYSRHVANPDLIWFDGRWILYFRGQDERGHDEIGWAWTTLDKFDGSTWTIPAENPVLRVSTNRDGFDSGHILDPAALVHRDRIFLYYSAHHIDWKSGSPPSRIGLATSENGVCFSKMGPVMVGTAPEIVRRGDTIFLFFQRRADRGYFRLFRSQSQDGVHFEDPEPVLEPSREGSTFDTFSISTARIWQDRDLWYMAYGGCPKYHDYPIAIGLARSSDLKTWERYPCNPVLVRGAPGSWDEGAVWFGTVHRVGETYFMWYEGTGTGMDLDTEEGRRASKQCREEDYGGYAIASFSQIGLAAWEGDLWKAW